MFYWHIFKKFPNLILLNNIYRLLGSLNFSTKALWEENEPQKPSMFTKLMQMASNKKFDEDREVDEEVLKKIREELKDMRKVGLINILDIKNGMTKQISIWRYTENPIIQVIFTY